jgi:hypothetical protein
MCDPTYPFVVIERWLCDFCAQLPDPYFLATPRPAGYTPGPDERVATGTDGTTLIVRKRQAVQPLEGVRMFDRDLP